MQSYQVHFTLWVIKSNQLKKQTLKFQKIQVLESKMSYFNVDDNHILQSLEKINTLQVKKNILIGKRYYSYLNTQVNNDYYFIQSKRKLRSFSKKKKIFFFIFDWWCDWRSFAFSWRSNHSVSLFCSNSHFNTTLIKNNKLKCLNFLVKTFPKKTQQNP